MHSAHEEQQPAAAQTVLRSQIEIVRTGKLSLLRLSRPFAVAAHDLDLVRLHRLTGVLHLEGDVFDEKCPDLVAETVGIKMTLCSVSLATVHPLVPHRAHVP